MCPACYFPEALDDWAICHCCGFQKCYNHLEGYQKLWVDKGYKWWSESRPAPKGWDGERQFRSQGVD